MHIYVIKTVLYKNKCSSHGCSRAKGCLKYMRPCLDKALLPVETVFLVPAQQVGEGTSGQFKKRGQALLRSDKTSRAGDKKSKSKKKKKKAAVVFHYS